MKATRKQVYKALDTERLLQLLMIEATHGSPVERKPLECYALYIQNYARELETQLSRIWGPESERKSLDTIRKIGALCVAAMEVHGAQDRTFPVLARINGCNTLIQPSMFDPILPTKQEGAPVSFDPLTPPKKFKRITKRKGKKARRKK